MIYFDVHQTGDIAALDFTHVSEGLCILQCDMAIAKLELNKLPQECEQAGSWQQSAPW